jgi:hypothetical protein
VSAHAIGASASMEGLLAARYCAPAWAIFYEVANATGANGSRYADAVAMSLYPSRGLELHGFEVKKSRWDWVRERLPNRPCFVNGKSDATEYAWMHWHGPRMRAGVIELLALTPRAERRA